MSLADSRRPCHFQWQGCHHYCSNRIWEAALEILSTIGAQNSVEWQSPSATSQTSTYRHGKLCQSLGVMGLNTITYIYYLFSHNPYLVPLFTYIYQQPFTITTVPVPSYFIIEQGPVYLGELKG